MFLQILVTIFLILLIVDRWKPKKLVKLHQRLGNDWTHWPIVGNAMKLIGSNEDIMTVFMQMGHQAYKKKHQAISSWLGNIFFIGIADADQASAVLKSVFDKKYIHTFTKHLLGNGTVFAPVEIWHRRRKILIPTFAPRHVNKFVTVFEAQSKVLADVLESRVGKGNFSCYDYISPYALDSVCETLFGVNMDVQRQPGHIFFNALTACFKNIAARMCQAWLHIDAIYKFLPMYSREKQTTKTIHEFADNLIHKKKALVNKRNGDIDGTADKFKANFKTFLELMIENSKDTDKGYTHEELREELLVLVLAGTDTSTVGICFTIVLLSQHEDIQDKVYKEIQEVLGNSDKPLESEDLYKLKYTKAVIKESLRLYPPAPLISRYCKKDLELPSGLILHEGCNVILSIWSIQRNPRHWGDDANDFNPDRFLSGNVSTSNAFMPFSHGSRNCIGHQYAMLSMTTTLVTILRRYRFTPATNFKYDKTNPLRISFEIMLKHVDNFSVQIEHRDDYKQFNINETNKET